MGTPRTSTTHEYKLLYYRRCLLALLNFVWFALFAASVAVEAFGPSVSSSGQLGTSVLLPVISYLLKFVFLPIISYFC